MDTFAYGLTARRPYHREWMHNNRAFVQLGEPMRSRSRNRQTVGRSGVSHGNRCFGGAEGCAVSWLGFGRDAFRRASCLKALPQKPSRLAQHGTPPPRFLWDGLQARRFSIKSPGNIRWTQKHLRPATQVVANTRRSTCSAGCFFPPPPSTLRRVMRGTACAPQPHQQRMPMTTARAPYRLIAAFACLALAACTSGAEPSRSSQESRPMNDADAPYSDQPVEVNLGPHRFRIPANYFDTQRGQDSQGLMRLILQWPELEPLPPGVRYYQGGEERFVRNIDISPNYIDRVALQTSLERTLISTIESEQELRENPTLNPDLRIKGAPVHGLTPYYTDFAKVDAYYAKLYGDKAKAASERHSVFNNDWFVGRAADGTLTTVIKCTAREEPEGAQIVDGRLKLLDTLRLPSCDHTFLLPRYGSKINVSYLRIFMRDWQRIEQRVRDIFDRGHVADAAQR
ncbi:hypothetical protein [Lysobacter sp. CA199]|uniref:hypothetical protein n=1 Tax=Lysobacter sp. CA199 TaxID=3455608 RepID=UPI003F8D2E27